MGVWLGSWCLLLDYLTYVAAHGPSPPAEEHDDDAERVWGLLLIFGADAGVYSHGDNTKQVATRATWGMRAEQAIFSADVALLQSVLS
ncbi:MAG: hypothetical protein WCB10_21505 [Steroidobacteraceae bacterium]